MQMYSNTKASLIALVVTGHSSGMDVVVVGGGNAGFESAAQPLAYCKSVTLLSRSCGSRRRYYC